MKDPVRILLVDDHYVVRAGLAAILNLQPEFAVVAEAEDGSSALERFREHQPDVTLMDLRMPGMSGIEATAAIRQEFPSAKIIMLTTYDGDEDIYRALEAGACGYLLKKTTRQELVKAIRTVYVAERYIPAEIAQRLAERSPNSNLTAREIEVLQLVVKGLSNREIGGTLGCTERTAKFHVQNILAKLEVSDRTEAATAAIQRGILHFD